MDESSIMFGVPGDVAVEMKSGCSGISNCGCAKESSTASMPICFLVKEHAKSVVAIQDLQRRMESVESIQDDIIETIVDIRGISTFNKTSSSVNNLSARSRTCGSSFLALTKSSASKPHRFSYSFSPFKETQDVPFLLPKRRSYSLRDLTTENKKEVPGVISEQEETQKFLDLAKTKETALDSDKQDSGLDSDCRDQNDFQASLNKHLSNWPRQESGDELLHLLDEIGHKSEKLQQQLSNVSENSELNTLKEEMSKLQSGHHDLFCVEQERDMLETKLNCLELSSRELSCEKKDLQLKLLSTLVENQDLACAMKKGLSSNVTKQNLSACSQILENQSESPLRLKKNAMSKIDSSVVSSVLKETSVVDLQRQVLIYLVKNAVMQTKLTEIEQAMMSKQTENADVKSILEKENIILMRENRELRIRLDEQRLESDNLKSKIAMMERILHSVTVENRELNWQLEDSFKQATCNKQTKQNFSSSFTYGSATSKSMVNRRSSLPAQFGQSQDPYISCNKTKLLPNTSSFLNVTIEEQDEYSTGKTADVSNFNQYAPLGASTPAVQKQKELRFSTIVNASPVGLNSPVSPNLSHYHAIRKRLKSGDKDHTRTIKTEHEDELDCDRIQRSGGIKLSEKLPLENTNTFPFSTILEKLKANSEHRMSKNVSTDKVSESFNGQKSLSCARTKDNRENDTICQRGSSPPDSHGRKSTGNSRNLHQRIQDILDRITAETEESGT